MKEWEDVGENVASAVVLRDGVRQSVDLVGFVARHPPTPSFVAYRWMNGGKPVDLGPNHLPGVNKGLAVASARKDNRFSKISELVGEGK